MPPSGELPLNVALESLGVAAACGLVYLVLSLGGILPGAPASPLHSLIQASLVGLLVLGALAVLSRRRQSELRIERVALANAQAEADRLTLKLEEAQAQMRADPRLLCMCSWCKSIRDTGGDWRRLESYFEEHLRVDFTHGVCPECMRVEYPDLFGE
jgi:MYXO-CTERM domain-containing protein